jgi:hypothetical protein
MSLLSRIVTAWTQARFHPDSDMQRVWCLTYRTPKRRTLLQRHLPHAPTTPTTETPQPRRVLGSSQELPRLR